MNKRVFTVEVEYETKRIRHAFVTCPDCSNKFDIDDVAYSSHNIEDEVDLKSAEYKCPICSCIFGYKYAGGWDVQNDECNIVEVPYPKCSEGAKTKNVMINWE